MQTILLDRLNMLHESLFCLTNCNAVLREMSVAQMSRHFAVALVDAFGKIVRDREIVGVFHLKVFAIILVRTV